MTRFWSPWNAVNRPGRSQQCLVSFQLMGQFQLHRWRTTWSVSDNERSWHWLQRMCWMTVQTFQSCSSPGGSMSKHVVLCWCFYFLQTEWMSDGNMFHPYICHIALGMVWTQPPHSRKWFSHVFPLPSLEVPTVGEIVNQWRPAMISRFHPWSYLVSCKTPIFLCYTQIWSWFANLHSRTRTASSMLRHRFCRFKCIEVVF